MPSLDSFECWNVLPPGRTEGDDFFMHVAVVLCLEMTLSSPQRCPLPGFLVPFLQHSSSHSPSGRARAPCPALVLSDKPGCSSPGRICPQGCTRALDKFLTSSADPSWMRRWLRGHGVDHGRLGEFSLTPHPVHLIPFRNLPAELQLEIWIRVFKTTLSRYTWHETNCMYLKCTTWYIWCIYPCNQENEHTCPQKPPRAPLQSLSPALPCLPTHLHPHPHLHPGTTTDLLSVTIT